MNLIQIFQKFPDHASCIEHLEKVRWEDEAVCPYCGSPDVATKVDGSRIGRWNCHACKSSFNVLAGTIFEKTKIPLQKWFLAVSLVLNAKKSVSSHQLARDLDMNQKSAWFMAMRIRAAMLRADAGLLQGIVEADETYVGGKPRKSNRRDDDIEGGNKSKRGRGTDKLPVIGVVERGGKVVARPASKRELTGKGLHAFIKKHVDVAASLLVTDEFPAYRYTGRKMLHTTVNHAIEYANGLVHTNTMEGFWALVKRAWYGQHHHYRKEYAAFYIAEACFKYNERGSEAPKGFGDFMKLAIG